MSVNKVILIGRLGQDPELRYTPTGTAVCNFSVATSESWNDKSGQRQERTEWHRIVVWGKLGELCNQYLSKGRQAYIEGKLQTRSWDDKETGKKRYATDVQALTVQFIGGPQANAGNENSYGNNNSTASNNNSNQGGGDFMNQNYEVSTDANFTSDDIPF